MWVLCLALWGHALGAEPTVATVGMDGRTGQGVRLKAREMAAEQLSTLAEARRIEAIQRLEALLDNPAPDDVTRAEMMLRLADLYFQQGRSHYLDEYGLHFRRVEACDVQPSCDPSQLEPVHEVSFAWYRKSVRVYEALLRSFPRTPRADEDAVVEAMQVQYGFDEFFLYGHSWGGALGNGFLLDGRHRDDVVGWIDNDGDHDMQLSVDLSRLWMMDKCRELIADGIDADFWRDALDFYEAHPTLAPSDMRHYSYAALTNAYFHEPENYEPPAMGELAFQSPFSMSFFQNEARHLRLDRALADGLDLSDRMHEITVPTLLLWGAEDGVVPPGVGEDAYARLGTPAPDKHLVIIPDVAHSPHDEDPDRFAQEVADFIDTYADAPDSSSNTCL